MFTARPPPTAHVEHSLVGSVMGLMLFNKDEWGWGLSIQQLFLLNAMFPVFFIGPWVMSLRETAVVSGSIPVKQRLQEQVCGACDGCSVGLV